MNIGSIAWPNDGRTAINLYLEFIIQIVEKYQIRFPASGPDPVPIAKRYISGELSEHDYREQANSWWNLLDAGDAIRDFQSEGALKARVAICLLSVTLDDVDELGEHLSWFFEVIEQLDVNLEDPIEMMAEYFDAID